MADRFFIAPYDTTSGLQNNVRPWLIPDDAFAQMENAYVFRGRVRKRFGSRWLGDSSLQSRFRIQITVTDINGDTPAGTFVPLSGGAPIATIAIGQMFSIGDQVFTVIALGNPAAMLISGAATLATIDTTTGAVVITGADALTEVYYYPSLPVMGLLTKEEITISDEFVIGFDTRFAYQYVSGWERLNTEGVAGAASWQGSNSQFFWGTTWTGNSPADKIFFVTNFNPNETHFMRRYNGAQWDEFRPRIDAAGTTFLLSARILVPFKNRLVAFNTYEGSVAPGTQFSNRCRYSQVGSPLAVDAWDQDVPGKGNAIDAPTSEAIVTVEFVKDRLIVYFERSTWELVYLGNQAFPFGWQKINTELGAESTFTIIPLDSQAIGIGNVGIHACNGTNVVRIDNKIPNLVFDIHNVNQGIERVYGIRDYQVEALYWAYPHTDATTEQPYPTKVLLYNYRNDTWAINDDSVTAFGYFQPLEGTLWSSSTVSWSDPVLWGSGLTQAKQRQVVAGNQQGYTFICDANETSNAEVLQITNMAIASPGIINLIVIDHNLRIDDYIYINGAIYDDASNSYNNMIYRVASVIDKDTIQFNGQISFTGTYIGGGLIARVSRIYIKTKEYNFYAQQGKKAYIPKVEFMVDATDTGEIQVDFYVSTNQNPFLPLSQISGALIGTGVLDTFPYTAANSSIAGTLEQNSQRLWHPVYFQAAGNVIQLELGLNDVQMRDVNIREDDFQLHAICFISTSLENRLE